MTTPEQRAVSAISAWRLCWLAGPGDVLFIPAPIEKGMLDYIGRIKGFDASEVHVVTPASINGTDSVLVDAVLRAPETANLLKKHIAEPSYWKVLPYYFTPAVVDLAANLGIPLPPGSSFAAQAGTDIINRKTVFRALAAGRGLPTAEGAVCGDPEALAAAITRLIPKTGMVIVKQDANAGGDGNVVLCLEKPTPVAGASRVLRFTGENIHFAKGLWESLIGSGATGLVVESYYPSREVLYSEYLVLDSGVVPRFLNSGQLRMSADGDPHGTGALLWVGFNLPARLPPHLSARFATKSAQLAALAGEVGYRGRINLDAIVTESGRILFTEINGRLGGCSHLHDIAELLLGPHYGDRWVLASRNRVPAPALTIVLERLEMAGLAFDRQCGEGILVMVSDSYFTQTIEYLAIASNDERLCDLEAKFLDILGHVAC